MNQGVSTIENGQGCLMTFHEPLLYVVLFPREKKTCPAELFKVQNGQPMRLGNVYDRTREYYLSEDFCQAVEEIGDDPVKHFYEERELL